MFLHSGIDCYQNAYLRQVRVTGSQLQQAEPAVAGGSSDTHTAPDGAGPTHHCHSA